MRDTGFETRESQVFPHNRTENGWTPAKQFPGMPLGDGGLISTARDYGKFLRCLLQKGKPLISEATLKSMVTNQIGELTIQTQPAANKAWTHPFPTGAGFGNVHGAIFAHPGALNYQFQDQCWPSSFLSRLNEGILQVVVENQAGGHTL